MNWLMSRWTELTLKLISTMLYYMLSKSKCFFEKLINFNPTEHFLTLSFQNITKHVEQFIVQFELKSDSHV